MTVRILDSAKKHLVEGSRSYDEQTQGLGSYFLDSLYAEIDALVLYGNIHARRFGFYRSVSKRFPFAVYYLLDGDLVSVHAVLDCRRSPPGSAAGSGRPDGEGESPASGLPPGNSLLPKGARAV